VKSLNRLEIAVQSISMKLILSLLFALALFGQAAHRADLTWGDTTNPAGTTYSVYRATGLCSGSPVFSKIASAVTTKTYSDTSVTPGNYCFQVTATANGMDGLPYRGGVHGPVKVIEWPATSQASKDWLAKHT